MKVQVRVWEAVWEKSVATIDIPDDVESVREWLFDNMTYNDELEGGGAEWLADAYHEVQDVVDGVDAELEYEIVKVEA